MISDFPKTEVQTFHNQKSRLPENGSADFPKQEAFIYSKNHTDKSNLYPSIHQSEEPIDAMDRNRCRSGVDESLFLAMLAKLDVSKEQMEKDMSALSAGQKKKVLLARSICQPKHLHVWDEPMNYIDVISRMQIEELLLTFQPTILFVEHDKTFCDRVATKIVRL